MMICPESYTNTPVIGSVSGKLTSRARKAPAAIEMTHGVYP